MREWGLRNPVEDVFKDEKAKKKLAGLQHEKKKDAIQSDASQL